MQLDLAISLGPDSQTAFQLRRLTGRERAYPFDRWLTPLHSLARVIAAEFRLRIEPGNLVPTEDGRGVLNRAFDIVHLHDFPHEDGQVVPLDAAILAKVSAKHEALGDRFLREVERAHHVGFFLGRVMSRNRYSGVEQPMRESCLALLEVLRQRFPRTECQLFVANGERLHGLDPSIVPFACPDHGDRWQDEPRHHGGSVRGWDEGWAGLGCTVGPAATPGRPPRPVRRKPRRDPAVSEVDSLLGIGRALQHGGGSGAALPVAIEVVARAPEDYRARTLLAQVLDGAGAYAAGAHAWERAIELRPGRAWPHYRLSQDLKRLGRAGGALEHAGQAVGLDPDSILYQSHRDRLLERAAG